VLDGVALVLEYDVDDYLRTRQPYVTMEQIRGLPDNGFTTGAHNIDHFYLGCISLADQLQHLRESVEFLKSGIASK